MCGFKGETNIPSKNVLISKKHTLLHTWSTLPWNVGCLLNRENKQSELLALFNPTRFPSLEQCGTPNPIKWQGQFWLQFVVQTDCFSFSVPFIVGIGTLGWLLQPWLAFDRPTYQKVVPQHLVDCLLLPPDILQCLI